MTARHRRSLLGTLWLGAPSTACVVMCMNLRSWIIPARFNLVFRWLSSSCFRWRCVLHTNFIHFFTAIDVTIRLEESIFKWLAWLSVSRTSGCWAKADQYLNIWSTRYSRLVAWLSASKSCCLLSEPLSLGWRRRAEVRGVYGAVVEVALGRDYKVSSHSNSEYYLCWNNFFHQGCRATKRSDFNVGTFQRWWLTFDRRS